MTAGFLKSWKDFPEYLQQISDSSTSYGARIRGAVIRERRTALKPYDLQQG